MGWIDRIKEAAYTPPRGTRLTFHYEDVSHSVSKKTTAFDFSDSDGTFIQDLGATSRRYPLRIFFWGDDHDLEANVFMDALLQKGVGVLEHPMYGVVDVVPFGEIRRRDDLKTASNQTAIEVRFFETTGILFPSPSEDVASVVLQAVEDFRAAASQNFADSTDLDTASERVSLKSEYQTLLDSVVTATQSIANAQDDVRIQFDSINDSIQASIDTLVADPLTLAFQTTALIQTPARTASIIGARLEAYTNLAASIIATGIVVPGDDSEVSNNFHVNDLYAQSYVTGAILSVVNTQFETKGEAISSADLILTLFDDVAVWRDDNFSSLDEIDTGEAYQQLQDAAALAAGFLVQISFTLKQEKSLVLDRARTVVDVVAELYEDIDENLDLFINSNNLTGDEIVELPKGREVLYYV